ncbi:hypothetical protein FJ366_03770 [Candidatus Dependentiae bacterium]|nr:hypothetical protein [Candidatus Dependentiae bacterium]
MYLKKRLPVPLFPALIGSIVGILWQPLSLISSPSMILCILIASIPLVFLAHKRGSVFSAITTLYFCLLLSAFVSATPGYFLKRISEQCANKSIMVRGKIEEIKPHGRQKVIILHDISYFVDDVWLTSPWFTTARIIGCFSSKIKPDDQMEIRNIYFKIPKPDLLPFLYKEHCLGFFFTSPENCTHSPGQPSKTTRIKMRINDAIANNLSRDAQGLVKSIFLGKNEYLPSKTRDLFERWGISHFLARSGIHLIVFAALLIWILQYFLLPHWFSRAIVASVTIAYYLISSPSISFIRAFSMNLLLGLAFFLGESAQLLHLFSIITLAALNSNPFVLYGLDFQLSFGISGALIFIFTIAHSLTKS